MEIRDGGFGPEEAAEFGQAELGTPAILVQLVHHELERFEEITMTAAAQALSQAAQPRRGVAFERAGVPTADVCSEVTVA